MSTIKIKRKDGDLSTSKLEYGELGIANNRMYFGGSGGF